MKKEGNQKEKIEKGFDDWEKVFSDLIASADSCYMPLLARSLELSKEIVEVYKKAFLQTVK